MRISRLRSLLVGLLLLAPLAASAATDQGQLLDLQVAGISRSYKLFVPEGAAPGELLPLMIVMHGGLGNADEVEHSTGMNRIASANRFMVAYPNGSGGRLLKNRRTWNAGTCCGPAVEQKVDDVQFIHHMLADIASQQPLDRSRVYATGLSNGAMMAYRLACDMPDEIAAIIPVAGTLALDNCAGAKHVAVLHIHGTQDSNVPYAGGMGQNAIAGVAHRSVPETLQIMATTHGCGGSSEQNLPDGSTLASWNCPSQTAVQLRLIPDGEHAWPGGDSRRLRKRYAGNFSASQAAWDFARQFRNSH